MRTCKLNAINKENLKRKFYLLAVLNVLPECCTFTMHPEISTRGRSFSAERAIVSHTCPPGQVDRDRKIGP